jgi:hypothetical protein
LSIIVKCLCWWCSKLPKLGWHRRTSAIHFKLTQLRKEIKYRRESFANGLVSNAVRVGSLEYIQFKKTSPRQMIVHCHNINTCIYLPPPLVVDGSSN